MGATDDDPPPVPANTEIAKLRSKVFLQHARRTRAFWNLPFIHFLGCAGHAIVIWHVVCFATEQGLSNDELRDVLSLSSEVVVA